MNYKDYQNSRDMAWRILLQENVTELPVKVGDLCRQMGIKIAYYDCLDDDDGKSTIIDGQPWILIAKDKPVQRQRFTCAHELGHILLGHTGKYKLVNREPSSGDNPIEQEANVFASRLLAPACVLWKLNARTPEEIATLCDISYQAAEFRAARMQKLYQRNKFLTHPLERAVYEQFADFIRSRGGLL
jgi:Zn-dependent peptidase ImmA (M78 family)